MGAAGQPLPRCWSSDAKCPRLPRFKRAAIQAKGMLVLERNSRANCSSQRPTAAARASAPWPAPDSNARNHTPSASLPASLLTGLRQRLSQPLPVLVILQDGLSPVAPIHHMIDCPRVLNAHLPSHAPGLLLPSLRGQQNNTISILLKNPLPGGISTCSTSFT